MGVGCSDVSLWVSGGVTGGDGQTAARAGVREEGAVFWNSRMRGTPATAQHLPVRERTRPDSAVCSSVRASRETVTVAGLRGESWGRPGLEGRVGCSSGRDAHPRHQDVSKVRSEGARRARPPWQDRGGGGSWQGASTLTIASCGDLVSKVTYLLSLFFFP